MGRFIIRIGLFGILTLIGLIGLYFIPMPSLFEGNTYMGGMVKKHARLNSIEGSRLLITGGSSVAFGMDSGALEEAVGLPTVNLAIHAGLGSEYIIQEVKDNAREGDIVLISLEYFLKKNGNNKLKSAAVHFYPDALQYFDVFFQARLCLEKIKSNVSQVMGIAQMDSVTYHPIYNKGAFNKYGDVVSHFALRNLAKLNGPKKIEYEKWDAIDDLNELQTYAVKSNFKVYYHFPCIALSRYRKSKSVIMDHAQYLQDNLYIPIINHPQDVALQDSFFFDTVYHLNKKGRKIRTESLIQSLKENNIIQDTKISSTLSNSFWEIHQGEIGYSDLIKKQLQYIEAKYAKYKIWQMKNKAEQKRLRGQAHVEYVEVLGPEMSKKYSAIRKRNLSSN